MNSKHPKIVVAGAGSIGCYAGGCLALAGRRVALLARPRIADAIRAHGLRISDLDGRDRTVAPLQVTAEADPAVALAGADIVLVTVKSGATTDMAGLIAKHAPAAAIVVSLQNGVDNPDVLRAALPEGTKVFAGMVPFNVIQTEAADTPLRLHRATSGTVLVGAGDGSPADLLNVEGFSVKAEANMTGVAWAKLLLNLNNALNALSGLPLATELADRRWRLLLAAQIAEALALMHTAGIKPARIEGVHPAMLPAILRLPDWLFRLVARRMLSIDPEARSSMWEDFVHRRPTEIDQLQGTVVRLAARTDRNAPLAARIVTLVREAEARQAGSPGLSPEKIALPE